MHARVGAYIVFYDDEIIEMPRLRQTNSVNEAEVFGSFSPTARNINADGTLSRASCRMVTVIISTISIRVWIILITKTASMSTALALRMHVFVCIVAVVVVDVGVVLITTDLSCKVLVLCVCVG